MEAAKLAEAAHALGHAEQPLEQVQIVRALVHEHAAALALPGAAPAAGGVVVVGAEPVGDFPVNAPHLAELAAVDEVLDFLEGGVRAHVEHGGEDFLFVGVGGDEALTVGFVDGDGLFDQDVKPGVERLDADGGVGEVGRADEDGVDVAGADHFIDVGEGLLSLQQGGQGADALAQGGHAQSGHLAGADVMKVGFAHVAEADDAESDVFHSGRRLADQASGSRRKHPQRCCGVDSWFFPAVSCASTLHCGAVAGKMQGVCTPDAPDSLPAVWSGVRLCGCREGG
jgi:hypothetical protein